MLIVLQIKFLPVSETIILPIQNEQSKARFAAKTIAQNPLILFAIRF